MKKVQFSIKDLKAFPDIKGRQDLDRELKNSMRKYKNLSVRADHLDEEEVRILFRNNWVDAKISITNVKSTCQLVKYLGLITPSLKSLHLTIGNIKKINQNLKLDSATMKSLSFVECDSTALEVFVADEDNTFVQSLHLTAIRQSREQNSIKLSRIYDQFIEHFRGLTTLEIRSSRTANEFFLNDISYCAAFRLKVFQVEAPPSAEACSNIEKFLISQGTSLVEVSLFSWRETSTIYRIWNNMDKLKCLQISNHQCVLDFADMSHYPLLRLKLEYLNLSFPHCEMTMAYLHPVLLTLRESGQINTVNITVKKITQELLNIIENSAPNVIINGNLYAAKPMLEKDLKAPSTFDLSYTGNSTDSYESSDSNLVEMVTSEPVIMVLTDSD